MLRLTKSLAEMFLFLMFSVGHEASSSSGPRRPAQAWYKHLLSEGDARIMEHSGKMVLLFEILRMAEDLGDKVYVLEKSSRSRSGYLFKC